MSGNALPIRMSCLRPANDRLPNLQPDWLQDVALLAVRITDERDPRRTVGVVLDRTNLARDAELVALKVDQAQLLLVAATVMADHHPAHVVTPAGALLHGEKRLMWLVGRQVIIDQRRREAQCRCRWSICLNRHLLYSCLTDLSVPG